MVVATKVAPIYSVTVFARLDIAKQRSPSFTHLRGVKHSARSRGRNAVEPCISVGICSLPGKKPVKASEFLRSHPLSAPLLSRTCLRSFKVRGPSSATAAKTDSGIFMHVDCIVMHWISRGTMWGRSDSRSCSRCCRCWGVSKSI